MQKELTSYQVADLPEELRPLNRLREAGAPSLSTAELLACVLQTRDALQQAQRLLATTGGLAGLARTERQALSQIGMTSTQAARLVAALELGRRILTQPEEAVAITGPHVAEHVLAPLIGNQEQEYFVVLYLNTRNQVVDKEMLYKGTLNTSIVRICEVFRGAVRRNCSAILVAHNHPSGDPSPSPEDVALTRRLVEAGKLMEIEVLDHLVIGLGEYVSLRERGLGWD